MVTDGSKVNFELLTGRMVEAWERDTHGLAVRTHWYDASQVQRRYGACSHVVQIKMLRCPGLVTWNNDIWFFLLPDDPKESLRVFHEMVCNAVQYPCPRRLDDPQYTHDYASAADGQRADTSQRESILLIDHGSKAWPAYGMWGKQIVSRHLFKQLVSSRIMLNAIIMMVTLVSASTHCGLGGWRRAFSRRWWIHMMFFSNSLV